MVQLLTLCPLIFSVCQPQHLLACLYSDLLLARNVCSLPAASGARTTGMWGRPCQNAGSRLFVFVCLHVLVFCLRVYCFVFYFQTESHIAEAGFRFTMLLRLVLNWSFCLYRPSAELQPSLCGALLMSSLSAQSPSSAFSTSRSRLLESKTSNCLVPLHPSL